LEAIVSKCRLIKTLNLYFKQFRYGVYFVKHYKQYRVLYFVVCRFGINILCGISELKSS